MPDANLESSAQPAPTQKPADLVGADVPTLIEFAQQAGPDAALEQLDELISQSPRHAAPRRAKAYILAQLGRLEEAISVHEAALKLFPDDPELLEGAALAHFEVGNFERARETFDGVIRIEPKRTLAWLGKSASLFNAGALEEALASAQRALELDPSSGPGYTLSGHCKLQLRQWAEAFADYTDAARYSPQEFDWAESGDRFLASGAADFALAAYERAIEAKPGSPAGWHGKGEALERREDVEGAIAAFEKASQIDGRFIAGYLSAGQLCERTKQFDRALEFYGRARAAQPEDPRPLVAEADLYAARRQFEPARDRYEEATRLEPSYVEAWNALGNSLRELGRIAEALRSYDRAIELAPDWGWPHYGRSDALFRERRFEEALGAVEEAIRRDPNNWYFLFFKLSLLERVKRFEEADQLAEHILSLEESAPELRVYVATHFADRGNIDRVRDLLNGIDMRAISGELDRLTLAECFLKINAADRAYEIIGDIDVQELSESLQIVWLFLRLLARRLVEGAPISDDLFKEMLPRFNSAAEHALVPDWEWGFEGIESALARSDLRLTEKFFFSALIDLQTGKLPANALSFIATANS